MSRILWLKEGDPNPHYFHNKASHRRRTNRIEKIKDASSVFQVDREAIEKCSLSYFQPLFAYSPVFNRTLLLGSVDTRFSWH